MHAAIAAGLLSSHKAWQYAAGFADEKKESN
jgi:hypothetical protein